MRNWSGTAVTSNPMAAHGSVGTRVAPVASCKADQTELEAASAAFVTHKSRPGWPKSIAGALFEGGVSFPPLHWRHRLKTFPWEQMFEPPQSAQRLRMRPCWQIEAPPHSLHLLGLRLCWQRRSRSLFCMASGIERSELFVFLKDVATCCNHDGLLTLLQPYHGYSEPGRFPACQMRSLRELCALVVWLCVCIADDADSGPEPYIGFVFPVDRQARFAACPWLHYAQKIHFVASKQVYPEFSPIAFEVQVFEAILGHQACVIISINGRTVQV